MRVRTAGKLGYCFGVSQAIEKAVSYAEGGKVYTLGTLAHNEHVVQYLREKGVEPLPFEKPHPDVPGVWAKIALNAKVAITAHGAPPEYYERRAENKVKFVGTFNQLFTAEQDFKELGFGKKVAVISQTTKVLSDFAEFITTLAYRNLGSFEELRVINTICPIVAARVNETRKLSENVDMMFVVGSQESANTKNLADVARPGVGPDFVYIVQDVDQVGDALSNWYVENDMAFPRVGVTAGTSTPIEVVNEVVTKLKDLLYERENSN